MGESKDETHPATYAPAGNSRGEYGSNVMFEALNVKGPKAGHRLQQHRLVAMVNHLFGLPVSRPSSKKLPNAVADSKNCLPAQPK